MIEAARGALTITYLLISAFSGIANIEFGKTGRSFCPIIVTYRCMVYCGNGFVSETYVYGNNFVRFCDSVISHEDVTISDIRVVRANFVRISVDPNAIYRGNENGAADVPGRETLVRENTKWFYVLTSYPVILRPFNQVNAHIDQGGFPAHVSVVDFPFNLLPCLEAIKDCPVRNDSRSFTGNETILGRSGIFFLSDCLGLCGGSQIRIRGNQLIGLRRSGFHFGQLSVNDIKGAIGDHGTRNPDQKESASEYGYSDGGDSDAPIKLICVLGFAWLLAACGLLRSIFWILSWAGSSKDGTKFIIRAFFLGILSTVIAIYATNGLIGAIDRLP